MLHCCVVLRCVGFKMKFVVMIVPSLRLVGYRWDEPSKSHSHLLPNQTYWYEFAVMRRVVVTIMIVSEV